MRKIQGLPNAENLLQSESIFHHTIFVVGTVIVGNRKHLLWIEIGGTEATLDERFLKTPAFQIKINHVSIYNRNKVILNVYKVKKNRIFAIRFYNGKIKSFRSNE